MFLLGNVWLVLLKTGFMFLRKKNGTKFVLVLPYKNLFLNRFQVFVRECLVSVIENRFHVFKNKKRNQTCSCSPLLLFFQNKNQFLNRFHVFVRECLVSVIENRFHVFKNKQMKPNLFLLSPVLVFSE